MALTVTNTQVYFDRSIIKKRWKFNRGPLGRAGAWLMRYARKSIRRRLNKNLHSPAGMPPYSHVPGSLPPFKQIFFQPNNFSMSIVVGMVGYGGSGPPVPGLQEHGGYATRQVYKVVGYRQLRRRFKNPRRGGAIRKHVREGVRYPERPFMEPALAATLPQLPHFWKNSLTF